MGSLEAAAESGAYASLRRQSVEETQSVWNILPAQCAVMICSRFSVYIDFWVPQHRHPSSPQCKLR